LLPVLPPLESSPLSSSSEPLVRVPVPFCVVLVCVLEERCAVEEVFADCAPVCDVVDREPDCMALPADVLVPARDAVADVADPPPSTELLLAMPDEFRTLFMALELA